MRKDLVSIARRTYGYYQVNGARKLLKKIPQRLLLGPTNAPAPIHCSLPPDAQGIIFKRVENPGAPRRLTLVIPSVEKKHLYAGSWTALRVFWEAHKAHGYRVRILSISRPFDTDSLASIDFFSAEEIVTIESWDRERNEYCEVEDDEIFIATSWWTAYAIKRLELTHKVFYLVQDFEPSFYPWSQEYLLAMETYRFHYAKIINTSILYEFFRQQELLGDAGAIYFEPGINRELYHPGPQRNFARTGKAVILVYGRPSVVRNLFDLACLSLEHFLRSYPTYRDKVDRIISVGEEHATVSIDGFQMEARGKMPLEEWAGLARTSDVGVSLMCSPHPSYPPLEMAASGMVVVTNNMFNKDLSSLNDNFISDEPYVEQIAECIKQAIDRLEDQPEIDRHTALLHETLPAWEENLQKIVAFIGGGVDTREEITAAHVVQLKDYCGIEADHQVLEVGCGVGRNAIQLTKILSGQGGYTGIDIIEPSILWCQENISTRFPNFRFHHLDIESQIHNAARSLKTTEVALPLEDSAVDRIFLHSVFTHMFEEDIVHYLREFGRVLKPGGRVMASFFVLDEVARELLSQQEHTEFFEVSLSFAHEHGPGCYINDPEHPEGAVAYTEEALDRMIEAGGMRLARPVCKGYWSGREGVPDGQDVLILESQ